MAETVYVVDDDAAMRDSLAFLLETSGYVAVTFDGGPALLSSLPVGTPVCILTDVRMPGMSGLDLMQQLATRNPGSAIIVITGHADVPLAVEAMKGGAVDFLEKPFDDDVLLASLDRALLRLRGSEVGGAGRAAVVERLASLSARERQVLDALVAGKANKVIAFDLEISPRTVEVYRANVMTKMQAGSLSELVRMALLANLFPITG